MLNKIKAIRGSTLVVAGLAAVAALTVAGTAEAEPRWKRARYIYGPEPVYVVSPPRVVYRPAPVYYGPPPMVYAPAPAYPMYPSRPSISLTVPLGPPSYPVW
jgi:hypothetical protein